MTAIDMTRLSAHHTSESSTRRARQRYRAEWRLKMYGILAIALAGAALLTLMSTIVTKAVGVLYENYLVIETTLDIKDRDMERLRDPNPRIRASLNGITKDAMKAAVGGEVGRRERRQLYALLSTDAGLELGDLVKADLSLAGQTITYQALLDDEVQMYLKGAIGKLRDAGSTGSATPVVTEDGDRVAISLEMGALERAREAMRGKRRADARLAEAEAARQSAAVAVTAARLDTATEETRESLEAQLAGFTAARDAALAQMERLRRKAEDPAATLTLSSDDPSVLVQLNEGWVKIDTLAPDRGEGSVIEPLSNDSAAGAGTWEALIFDRPEASRNISDRQIVWLADFESQDKIVKTFNWRLLQSSDSSNAELAGIWGALVGSFWTMVVTFALAFPIGVLAAVYLEEFATKSRLTDFIEVNINNLAAVPSIVFGLLGLAIFVSGIELHILGYTIEIGGFMPRSSPLAGGTVLALMTLPTIIIASRAAIRAVPPSIRDAALGIGASKLQTVTHHVLPLAMPGILTGAILGMAQALGETAPLLLVGMNSFIQEPPGSPLDPGNVLPTLIFQWNNNSERLFDDKTAAAILVLLTFLVAMNALAVLLRKQFERRW